MPSYEDKKSAAIQKHAAPAMYLGTHDSDQPGVRYHFIQDGVIIMRDNKMQAHFTPDQPEYKGLLADAKSGYYKLHPQNVPAFPGRPADTNFRTPK